ncbi:TetR/AcrR family transcriptional regulator [Paenibacillus sonchi]|uniref:TetR/AcrR family transcriptional regulator n=1 Tax=Paenibacillus sonchi TaxID=373687 RepID=A0A974P9H9_9BACL|nr:TetR/AcrR family transcriptional regulator [Paenibacillus sonchi]MCE3201089.1 TetR/AcrR family transcriptional regulator [Paenibacillus sonchi]QQZ59820.1 TetR/AcrR family transcriptional regulator [Paenibacillus sonchi]
MSTSQEQDKLKTRRRGKELEAAILQAVREELEERGYSNLTMDGVAERSGTSKAVLYRRWANRAEIVLAAIRERVPLPLEEVPDYGNLRDDVCGVLRSMNQNNIEVMMKAFYGLVTEIGAMPLASLIFPEGRNNRTMTIVLQRAVDRGEISAEAVTPRMLTLPADLARNEIILYNKPMSEQTIAEIVDEVYLPLVLKR